MTFDTDNRELKMTRATAKLTSGTSVSFGPGTET